MRRLAIASHVLGGAGARWQARMATPFATLGIRTQGECIAEIAFLPRNAGVLAPADAAALLACSQIERYLEDPDYRFALPLEPSGTAFQRRVWNAIRAIRRGRTRGYGDIARELGSSARAVGQACGENPYPLVVPCHRVVSSSGLGGFAHRSGGYLIEAKRWLLAHEGATGDDAEGAAK